MPKNLMMKQPHLDKNIHTLGLHTERFIFIHIVDVIFFDNNRWDDDDRIRNGLKRIFNIIGNDNTERDYETPKACLTARLRICMSLWKKIRTIENFRKS